ncbi:Homocysteine S-methyltransferase [Mycobacterium talmoniae]|uniref:Homocysteine S-methyltransferase n=1 Tax=Mycobacterium talmoniae TaxID=1858794 RepID=A0A2S8BM41_9MYCO|nr:Homocysteine S-methyltransferase [Mycobacterium talmoniae]
MATVAFAVPDDTVLVSDGGLATELEARGHDLSDPLWSARLLVAASAEIEPCTPRFAAPVP